MFKKLLACGSTFERKGRPCPIINVDGFSLRPPIVSISAFGLRRDAGVSMGGLESDMEGSCKYVSATITLFVSIETILRASIFGDQAAVLRLR
jgi:hypothetical protein